MSVKCERQGEGGISVKCQEPLELFCKDEAAPISRVHEESKRQRSQCVVSVEESASKMLCLGIFQLSNAEWSGPYYWDLQNMISYKDSACFLR